jgi:hypothetical protein
LRKLCGPLLEYNASSPAGSGLKAEANHGGGLLKNRRVFTAFYLRSAAAYEDLTCPKQAPLVAGLFLLFCRAGLDGAVCSAGAAVGSSSITRGQNTGVSIANRVTRTHRVSGGSLTFCSTGVGTGGATRTIDR